MTTMGLKLKKKHLGNYLLFESVIEVFDGTASVCFPV